MASPEAYPPGAYPPRASPWRVRASVAIVLFMSALALCTLASYFCLLIQQNRDPGGILMDEDRFAGIRAILPPRGTVGYLSDTGSIDRNARAYYLTQYFLAPVVVAPDTAHEIVVANFASRSVIARLAADHNLSIENDFLNGVALLRRHR
jgi:hypothetical protein